MTHYTVTLDGRLKGQHLSFQDAVRLSTALAQQIGYKDFTTRIKITEE